MRARLALAWAAAIGAWGFAPAESAAQAQPQPQVPTQGFSAMASPSRFELAAKPGATTRQVLELQHVGRVPGRFRVYTNDWDLRADQSIEFSDPLKPGSCRPWVALERRELTISPGNKYRFRFEVSPPPGTPPTECRFAIMVEGMDPARVEDPRFTFPVSARLGVIVYVAVGEVSPRLVVGKTWVADRDGAMLPILEVANEGSAHGRLEAFLSAKDAGGRSFEMSPEDFPILPGRKREIALRPISDDGKPLPPIKYPLAVKGTLEWGGKREPFEMRFAP